MSGITGIQLSEAAAVMQGLLEGTDGTFDGVSTDTRQLQAGQLYVALRGPNFDGHDFVSDAAGKGAAAAVVEETVADDIPQIIVDDSRLALGQLAGAWRARFAIPVIAVTGSNGKTTVKEMLAAILGQAGPVLATRGNLNNEIGVPLSLLALGAEHRAAVIEEGASHAGDIAYLTRFVRPTVALVNNVSGAHLEGFGSVDVVARTKAEIYQYLAPGGVAVINADDLYSDLMRELAADHAVMTFALAQAADVRGQWQPGSLLHITTPQGEVSVKLALAGRHNAMNALAAATAALAAGATLEQIRAGLEAVQAVSGRLQWKPGIKGARVLDDSYNANPVSLAAALEVLAQCHGDHYLALGDMAELGEQAEAFHAQAGIRARESGVRHLYAVGDYTRHTVAAFGAQAYHFPAQDALIEKLKQDLHERVTLLVKGSRSAHMETVVAAVTAEGEAD